jgi:uncharacterized membrane protein YqaE (UPF0057 family)
MRSLMLAMTAVTLASPLRAQTAEQPDTLGPHRERISVPIPAVVGAGVLTAAASLPLGLLLGAWIGSRADCPGGGCGYAALQGAVLGAALLPPIAVPIAVHLTNARSGSFPAVFGASALAAAVGWKLVGGLDWKSEHSILLPPVAVMITSVVVELATESRDRPDPAAPR